MRTAIVVLSLVCAFTVSCAGRDPETCAFQVQDGSCAVAASSSGALECRLDDKLLCETVTAFVANRTKQDEGEGVATSALINTGTVGGGTSLVCEPDGTFMCTCCGVKTGCYPCPKKVEVFRW